MRKKREGGRGTGKRGGSVGRWAVTVCVCVNKSPGVLKSLPLAHKFQTHFRRNINFQFGFVQATFALRTVKMRKTLHYMFPSIPSVVCLYV